MKSSDVKKAFRGVGTMLIAIFVLLNALAFQMLLCLGVAWIIMLFGVAQIWTAFGDVENENDSEKEFEEKRLWK